MSTWIYTDSDIAKSANCCRVIFRDLVPDSFHGINNGAGSGTGDCNALLGTACVSDLEALALTALKKSLSSGNNITCGGYDLY